MYIPVTRRPVLLLLLHGGTVATDPVLASVDRIAEDYEIAAIPLTAMSPLPGVHTWVSPEEFDLPINTLRFCLSPTQLAAVIRPHAVDRFRQEEELVVLDGRALIRDLPLFPWSLESGLELFPELPRQFAQLKPTLADALAAGAARATNRLLRVRPGALPADLVETWRSHVWQTYIAGGDIDASERDVLSAGPALWPDVAITQETVISSWRDLHEKVPLPRVIDLDGFAEYLSAPGPALSLIERRTHDMARLDELIGVLPDQPAVAPESTWADAAVPTDLARDMVRAIDPAGERWPVADAATTRDDLEAADANGVPRFARALYLSRPDLRAAYPPATPARVFVDWLRSAGVGLTDAGPTVSEPRPLNQRLVGRLRRSTTSRREPTMGDARPVATEAAPVGVNLIGYLRAESGLGAAARATRRALRDLDIPVSTIDVSARVYSRQEEPIDDRPIGTPYGITVAHLNPVELLGYTDRELRYRLAADRVVGAWFWETDAVPSEWLPAFAAVDELWVASAYLAGVFGQYTDREIIQVGLPVSVPDDVRPDRARFGIPEGSFVVSYITDAFSGLDRKDPLLAVEAFRRAFGADPEAHLLLKVSNLEKFPAYAARLRGALQGLSSTVVGYLDRDALWTLMACSDVYLSLHASEGFGLTVVEAMSLGIPVVATAHGGSMDFTTPETSMLVDFTMVDARGGPGDAYSGNGRWARPDCDEAARHLRRLREDPALCRRLGEAGRRAAQTATPDAYAGRVADRLTYLGLSAG